MPKGKVKFFDAKKGFGFISGDDGESVYLPESALPAGARVKPGTRVTYGVADTRRGPQALQVEIDPKVASLASLNRRPAEEMVPVVEDLIKILDKASSELRRGHYPDNGARIARVLRKLADEFDA